MQPIVDSDSSSSVTRRGFLAQSAAAMTVVGASAGRLALADPDPAPPADQKKLGYAFVGIGSLCMNQLLPGIAKCTHSRPVALVSGHPEKAKAQADKHGIDPKHIYNYENFDSIKDNPEIDVVYVVLPNSMHAEYTIRAFQAGKHVLCEKPMAVKADECRQMIDAAKGARASCRLAIACTLSRTRSRASRP